MATSAKKQARPGHPQKATVHTNANGPSRDKVEKVTRVAIKTYEKAMKELEKH
ncbi:MAG: hypothetical protein WD904_04515 [Dehalococcoidia bacterium]